MSHSPFPAPIDGITWRRPTVADAVGLAAYTRLVHEAERLSFLPGEDFFSWLLVQPGIDLDTDVVVAIGDGHIVGDGGTWLHQGPSGARCIVWAEAVPEFAHLKPVLMAWVVEHATQRLEGTDPALPRVIRTSVEEHRTAQRGMIEAAGLTDARIFAEMSRPLTDLPEAPPLPDGIVVVPWSDDLAESVRIASNESFADHWGSLPMNREEFAAMLSDSPTFRPDLSFLAVAGNEVVALCLCEVDEEDNEDRDTNDVFVHRVGTMRAHRGLGLASHLIVRSLEAAAITGTLDRASLEVDEMSHTNATAVYERLGFETYARSVTLYREM